ncbi:protein-disulfide reductase DsbD domain-containing protein [Oharaeibacter diazotrophicus]|uniref:DsbC/DsbD-like thiol-disulfide interchange protein n=2 Tax=Oharaeibacter diazotrophicus TaxID=1920512 RepID=A0A4R6RBJ0_9HYPH|nr:protein-disulfide reductase DsbD domain-containing protein [Oharaeibacter diazotrophicus]TDP83404.1 DsbC/DsbD-like thiol-disulfide interchange protein [Oharaeibacter diazotrophicus]BBE72237.1 hypothetical protein OHA_1_01826 [Pleomorphomonas sp. SM30]GLS79005.1 protein involved in C cytochrome biogenesis [Oharaeibacter diazotrophicus]
MNSSFVRLALSALVLFSPVTVSRAGPSIPEPGTALAVAGPDGRGGYDVGVGIALPEGWHTYWRSPGDSGVPPVFDWSASENVAAFEVAWPAPGRYFDGFGTSVVYDGDVTLPVRVVPADPAAPVRLAVRLNYGYCKDICVPATAEFSADLDPAAPRDEAAAATIAAARASVPVPEAEAAPDAPRLVALEVAGEGRDARATVTLAAADAERVDLFVEGPDGWYLSPPERVSAGDGRAVFAVALDGRPKKAALSGAVLRFTIADGARSVEALRSLP